MPPLLSDSAPELVIMIGPALPAPKLKLSMPPLLSDSAPELVIVIGPTLPAPKLRLSMPPLLRDRLVTAMLIGPPAAEPLPRPLTVLSSMVRAPPLIKMLPALPTLPDPVKKFPTLTVDPA
jgi:hypothetical protein